MRRKPIKVFWDEVEEAFTSPSPDEVSYLDSVTGHVVLEGEGEPDEPEDDEEQEVRPRPGPERARQDPTRIRVQPPDLETKIDWMLEFLARSPQFDAAVVTEIREALEGDDPSYEVGELLNAHAPVRDAWYLFRAERVREWIDRWLVEHHVQAIDPPPWRV